METDNSSESAATSEAPRSEKSLPLTAVLAFFFGIFGAHRFYVGKTKSAVIQLLTIGGLGIWAFIDFIIILFGEFTDAAGAKIAYSRERAA